MVKRFGSSIRIITALFLSVFMTNFAPTMVAYAAQPVEGIALVSEDKKDKDAPAGNNGTVKIDDEDIDSNNNDNDNNPHVGCSFEIEWFGYDAGIRASEVTFAAHPPTAGQLVSPLGAQAVTFTGSTAENSVNHTQTFPLVFSGAPAAQGYHVKVTVKTDGSKGNDTKSKVFWVEACEAPKKETTPAAPSFDDKCGKRNDTYTINATEGVIYKVGGQTVTGTNPGSGTVKITAEAEAGYVLIGGTYSWEFTFTNAPCPITVTPPAPHPIDVCGTDNDGYFIPYQKGVKYKVNDQTKSFGFHSATGTVTITAHSSGAPYVLDGQTTWIFELTNKPCVEVTVDSSDECVERGTTTGEISVNVTNNHLIKKAFRVTVDGEVKYVFVAPGQTKTVTFDNFGPGTYDISVDKLVANSFSLAPVALDNVSQFSQHRSFNWENVFEDTATLEECPVEEPGRGEGHVLGTTTQTPTVLPNTGSNASATLFIALLAGLITFVGITRKTVRE